MEPRQIKWIDVTRRDLVGVAIGIAVAVAIGWVYFTFAGAYVRANMGFGPEWECSNPYNNGPICVKKSPTGDPPQTAN